MERTRLYAKCIRDYVIPLVPVVDSIIYIYIYIYIYDETVVGGWWLVVALAEVVGGVVCIRGVGVVWWLVSRRWKRTRYGRMDNGMKLHRSSIHPRVLRDGIRRHFVTYNYC